MTRAERIQGVLRTLVSNTPDLEGAALVSVDGLLVASVLPSEVDEDRVSAMAAAMLALGERTTAELTRGELQQMYVKGQEGYVVMMSVGEEGVLEGISGKQAKLGMVLLDMKRAASELAGLV